MGLRFRRSVKICKGVRVNFSKSGPSLTLGTRGAKYTIGSNGRRTATIGIPGTGISYTETTRNSKKSTTAKKYNNATNNTTRVGINVEMDDNGEIMFLNENHEIITDASLIRKIKNSAEFKSMKSKIDDARQKLFDEKILAQQQEMDEFTNLHKHANIVHSSDYYLNKLEKLNLKTYKKKEFTIPEPIVEQIKVELQKEAIEKVKTLAIWNLNKLRNQYVDENLSERFECVHQQWQDSKEKFIKQEIENEKKFNDDLKKEINLLKLSIEGNEDLICSSLESWISEHSLPVEININYEYDHKKGDLCIDLDLPEIEDLPTTEYVVLASGKLKEKNKTKNKLKDEYASLVFGLTVYLTSSIFNISPKINRILISGYTQRIIDNRTKEVGDDYIYSIKINRSDFEHKRLSNVNPLQTCLELENRCLLSQSMVFKAVKPFNSFEDE